MRSHLQAGLACTTLVAAIACKRSYPACESGSFIAHCDGNTMVYCSHNRAYGQDFGSKLEHVPCGQADVCNDFGAVVGCVRPPLTSCDPTTYIAPCVANTPLACGRPSVDVTADYVKTLAPCANGEHCVSAPNYARCER